MGIRRDEVSKETKDSRTKESGKSIRVNKERKGTRRRPGLADSPVQVPRGGTGSLNRGSGGTREVRIERK
jgi:hypothetical protein